jgi:UDP-N-acetyl-D-mannosaminuronic acid dehydrogenase
MKICVVGLGYIGLPTAAMLASRGHEVVGYDVRDEVVAAVNAGEAHFQEPDLQMLLSAAVGTGRLRASTQPEQADFFLIAVPTPIQPGGAPDMSYVERAAHSVAPVLTAGCTVILESTSPVGSTETLSAALAAARPDLIFPRYKEDDHKADVAVCHCPERILPGRMMTELVSNDRIIGGLSWNCADKALELYKTFVMGTCYVTDARTAELVKLAENAFRDVNIAYANELSMICDSLGVDVWAVRELANKHPRVEILSPGAGVGGHCIAVDPWFIVSSAPQLARLIRTARIVNDDKPHRIVGRVRELADRFKSPVIACYGLTYKPDVDDVRESPALEIVAQIAAAGDQVLVCEPNLAVLPEALSSLPNVALVDATRAQTEADIAVFLVGHRQFRRVESGAFLGKAVVDAIGLLARPAVSAI